MKTPRILVKAAPGLPSARLRFGATAVPFTVGTNSTQKVMSDARAFVSGAKPDDWRAPYRAASWAIDNGVDVEEGEFEGVGGGEGVKVDALGLAEFLKVRGMGGVGKRTHEFE